jgi:hypothetical protein
VISIGAWAAVLWVTVLLLAFSHARAKQRLGAAWSRT